MTPGPLDVRDYLSILWERKWTILAVVLTTTAVALAYSMRQPSVYTASAQVIVRCPRFDPTLPPTPCGLTTMGTEQAIANSLVVTDLATKRLGLLGVEPGSMEAAQVTDAETLRFTSVSTDPAAARATANQHANAYLYLRKQSVLKDLNASRQPLETQIDALTAELHRISQQLITVNDPIRQAALRDQYATATSDRAGAVARLQAMATPSSLQVGEVIQGASLPTTPSGPDHLRDALGGFVVGLALGIALALFRDRMDQRVRGRGELESRLGAPVLAYIPRVPRRNTRPVTLNAPDSEAAQAYDSLRVRLTHVADQRGVRSLVITSSLPDEGKTSTTANLGVTLARADRRVVIVSGDLRRPNLHTYFHGKDGKGLTEVLLGQRVPADAVSSTSVRNLWIVDTGPLAEREKALTRLGSTWMQKFLDELRDFADLVLIDTPPLLTSPDVVALAPLTDGALFVTDPHIVERPAMEQACHELELINVPLLGVVVNRYDPRRFRPYGMGYGYSYRADGHEQPPGQPNLTTGTGRKGLDGSVPS